MHEKTFQSWYFLLSLFRYHFFKSSQILLLQIFCLREGWPMGDHSSVFQEEPLGLQYYPNLLVFCRGGILIQILSAFVTIGELRSFWPECTLKVRHLLLQPYQGALWWYPSWRCPPKSKTRPLYFLEVFCKFGSSSDRDPSNTRCELFFPSFFAWRMSSEVLLSWHPKLEMSRMRSIIYPLRLRLLVPSKLPDRSWLVYPAKVNTSHISFSTMCPYVVASHFRMILYFLNLTAPHS